MSRGVLLIDDKVRDRSAIVGALIDTHSISFPFEQVGLLREGLERLSKERTKPIRGEEQGFGKLIDGLPKPGAAPRAARARLSSRGPGGGLDRRRGRGGFP